MPAYGKAVFQRKWETEMKIIFITVILILSLAGCKEVEPEDKFVGNWIQVNANDAAKLTASIVKAETGYLMNLKMIVQDQAPVIVRKTGKIKDGMLRVDGLEKIQILPANGHMMIGVNEFELKK
jgi:hypothetical protein